MDIRLAAMFDVLPLGGHTRTVCPKCGGGSSAEQSLAIYRSKSGVASWHCFRASCGWTGGDREFGGRSTPAVKEPRIYTRPIEPLTDAQREFFVERFGIFASDVAGYNRETDRFLFRVDSWSHSRGYVSRSFSGDKPKTLSYNEKPDEPFIHWAMPAAPSVVVVVEDWLSAEKVADAGLFGVALQGTRLSRDMVKEIADNATRFCMPTYLAFDRDAYAKSLEYQQMYRERFPYGLKVARLGKDLKYVSVEKIKHEFESGTADFIGNY